MFRNSKYDTRKTEAFLNSEAAVALAIDALGFLAARPDALARFLSQTGIGPSTLRATARDPAFLAAVIDYLLGDEDLLVAYAGHAGIEPGRIAAARRALK